MIEIDGEPGVRVRLEPTGEHFDGAVTTAMPVVNAIPAGGRRAARDRERRELPFVKGAHLVGRG